MLAEYEEVSLNHVLEKLYAPHTDGIGPTAEHKGVEVCYVLDLFANVVEQCWGTVDLAAGITGSVTVNVI
jgi:hypothetical protein